MSCESGEAMEPLLAQLYEELRRGAERMMRGQPRGHTLGPTALVHEAYLRLARSENSSWADRSHCFATAAKAMRHVLVDHARGRRRMKRAPRSRQVELEGLALAYEDHALDIVALDEALGLLETRNPTMARAVELRFFGGLDAAECAKHLGLSKRTFDRHWAAVRAWLFSKMR